MVTTILYIIYALIIFGVLITVHEFGHLITAKAVGIKVNEFAIGMGPKLFGFGKGETKYSLRAFPIGGYCAMEGEDEDSQDPRAFNNKGFPAKALVVVAGSLMNAMLAVIILSMVIFSIGSPTTTLGQVNKDGPAARAGILAGDTITSIDGKKINKWEDLGAAISSAKGKTVDVAVTHKDGSSETLTTKITENDDGNPVIGVQTKMERTAGSFFTSIGKGFQATGSMAKMTYEVVGSLFTGGASFSDFTGPVGIVKAVGDSAKIGFVNVAYLAALISLNLAIINLLPLPALDGGRLLFLVIRLFTGKRISDNVEGKIHFVGMMLLFALMIYITVIDVDRFII